jgi:MYXO-CTERM domain-containing protein
MLLLALLSAAQAEPSLLFVGNSYTFVGDLDLRSAELLRTAPEMAALEVTRLAEPGYTWTQHLELANTAGSAWSAALVSPTTPFDWVILQEQSQIPGFPSSNSEYMSSLSSVGALDDLIEAQGASTLLLLTWGRRAGDETNPDLYPDFATMEALLEDGYRAYQAAITREDRPVDIIPAGPAFAQVYAADVAAGRDPLDPASLFFSLYQGDGSHPSPLGTYLVALTVYGTLTGESPVGLPAPDGTAEETIDALQEASRAAVFDGEWLPHTASGGSDSGGADGTDGTDGGVDTDGGAGSDGSDGSDGGDGAVGGADDGLTPREDETRVKDGCGACSASGGRPASSGLLFGLLGLLGALGLRRGR